MLNELIKILVSHFLTIEIHIENIGFSSIEEKTENYMFYCFLLRFFTFKVDVFSKFPSFSLILHHEDKNTQKKQG